MVNDFLKKKNKTKTVKAAGFLFPAADEANGRNEEDSADRKEKGVSREINHAAGKRRACHAAETV